MSRLVYNSLITPDGTTLVSRHRNDFQSHVDANGKTYFVDGGLDYVRSTCHGDEVFVVVRNTDPHEEIRRWVDWGTRGKDGLKDLQYVKIKDMSTDHIANIIVDNLVGIQPLSEDMRIIFINEYHYQKEGRTILDCYGNKINPPYEISPLTWRDLVID